MKIKPSRLYKNKCCWGIIKFLSVIENNFVIKLLCVWVLFYKWRILPFPVVNLILLPSLFFFLSFQTCSEFRIFLGYYLSQPLCHCKFHIHSVYLFIQVINKFTKEQELILVAPYSIPLSNFIKESPMCNLTGMSFVSK